MKFDYAIGNPPYQQSSEQNHRQSPVYDKFMDAAYSVADCTELITPARFLFRAGQTAKEWNEKMLNDEHFKVLRYYSDSSEVFQNVDIKGGVAISIHDKNKNYGKIGFFTTHDEVHNIVRKIKEKEYSPLSSYAFPKSTYGIDNELYEEHPELKNRLTKGNQNIIDANIFEKMPEVFYESIPKSDDGKNYICVYGRFNNRRATRWIKCKYIKKNAQLEKYKLYIPGANGTGALGEALSEPEIGKPNTCHTQTYMSIGSFDTIDEVTNCSKYIKTKFLRLLLGTLKVTQNNPRETWSNIPMQDFTSNSDINWSASIRDIDQQLYKKYGLSQQEIDFIESHVKEMA